MQVLVFKTNVRYKKHVSQLAGHLDRFPNINRWNFDLQDRDKILRIETHQMKPGVIEQTLAEAGYFCKELDY